MARAGYCKHGFQFTKSQEIQIDGKIITIPSVTCIWCSRKKEEDEREIRAKKYYEKQLVKENILKLLQEDESFKNELKTLLGL